MDELTHQLELDATLKLLELTEEGLIWTPFPSTVVAVGGTRTAHVDGAFEAMHGGLKFQLIRLVDQSALSIPLLEVIAPRPNRAVQFVLQVRDSHGNFKQEIVGNSALAPLYAAVVRKTSSPLGEALGLSQGHSAHQTKV